MAERVTAKVAVAANLQMDRLGVRVKVSVDLDGGVRVREKPLLVIPLIRNPNSPRGRSIRARSSDLSSRRGRRLEERHVLSSKNSSLLVLVWQKSPSIGSACRQS